MTWWRVAGCLEALLLQIDAAYPGRDRRSDGAIGDPAHASTVSDHNPDPGGVVHARDFTDDDLAPGMDANALAEQLRVGRDPRIKYVINDRRIFAGNAGPSPWVWRAYTGSDPHTSHVHVSVVAGPVADTIRSWVIAGAATTATILPTVGTTGGLTMQTINLSTAGKVVTGPGVAPMQRLLGQLTVDGKAGPATRARLGAVQVRIFKKPDYVFGSVTASAILDGR